jgi:tRNA threonylcarbamoyladenosine biosynthesis protein TsaE
VIRALGFLIEGVDINKFLGLGAADHSAQHMLRLVAATLYNVWVMTAIDLVDETGTVALAAGVAAMAERGDIIALKGDLGAGKTTFARAFIRARADHAGEIPSPTFTLVQVYELEPTAVWHFDLYRLGTPNEAWELGIEQAFEDGISLIEWPERLGPLLPPRRLEITLEFGDRYNSRRALLDAGTVWQTRLATITADA